MCGLDGFIAVLGLINEQWGPCALEFCKEDWRHGYRQLLLREEHKRYFVAAAEDEQGRIVCFVPKRLLFGPPTCPPQFSRVSEAFEWVLTVLLWVVTTHH